MNDNLNNNEESSNKNKIQRGYKIISLIIFFAICFTITYVATDKINNSNAKNNSEPIEAVYNNTKAIKDEMNILLSTNGVVEKEQTVSQFKEENNIGIDISEQFLVNFFQSKGYELKTLKSDEIVFEKEVQERVYESNKYYLGIEEEYFAIYKSDDKGKLKLEEVLNNYKDISVLSTRPEVIEEIKKLAKAYETKEEIYELVTSYTT